MPTDLQNGLYLVCGIAGNENMPGAPLLHFSLLVDTATGTITGRAVQTQAVAPPGDRIVIDNVKGKLRHTGLGKFTQIISLEGTAVISFPPPAIGSYLAPFDAHFATDNSWDGIGGWSLGHTDINDVPVKPVPCEKPISK